MATVFRSERCQTCKGLGEVPVPYDDGRGGAFTNWQACRSCRGTGRIRVAANTPDPEPADGMLHVGGFTVMAPTFRDAAQFDRAVGRAFHDGLSIATTDLPGTYLVSNPTHTSAYAVTRETCTCKAGQEGMPCKHIARVVFELDVVGSAVPMQEAA